MQRAAERAREGDAAYFQGLPDADLLRLIDGVDEDGRSLLHNAAASGNIELVQRLVEKGFGPSVNTADEEGWTPLISAVSAGHEQVLQLLLSLGANANAKTSTGLTALHYAASKGRAPIAQRLLQAGANPKAADNHKATPLHRAAGVGTLPVLRLLVEVYAVPLDPLDATRSTPLMLAVHRGAEAAALYLTSKGADVEAEDEEGATPLSAAARLGKLQQTMIAIKKGDMELADIMDLS